MAEVCEATGADVTALATALSYDDADRRPIPAAGSRLRRRLPAQGHPRVQAPRGAARCRPGGGLPGRGRRHQPAPPRSRTVDLVRELAGGDVAGKRVAALGAAFKPNSDDIRDAPALDVALSLHKAGAQVVVYDPAAMDNARRAYPGAHLRFVGHGRRPEADVVVLLTEWVEFREIDPDALAGVVRSCNVVDGRHALDSVQWRAAGWHYRALGRP